MATRVLLIEDDPRIQEIVERGLSPRGFVVTSASDGPSGLELADLSGIGRCDPGREMVDAPALRLVVPPQTVARQGLGLMFLSCHLPGAYLGGGKRRSMVSWMHGRMGRSTRH